uniref:Uncharacterized protein n=1 Tax=viral metagenome TaxID=1070528 RepID=A0A6H1ZF01_9ZZZZ
MKAIVKEIQVGGDIILTNLEDACEEYCGMLFRQDAPKTKIHFTIEMPDGSIKGITIRDTDGETVAYGDFEGLPSFLDYAKVVF